MKYKTVLNPILILSLMLALIVSFISVPVVLADGGGTWSTSVRVNDVSGPDVHGGSSLVTDHNGTLYSAWSDKRSGTAYDIYFAKSTNGGATWSSNIRVNDDAAGSTNKYAPNMVADGSGNIYLVWTDMRNGNHDVYFSKSTNGGATWSANTKISDDPGSTTAWATSLAVDNSGNLYATWFDNRTGNDDVYFAKSTNGGSTWSASVKVNDDATSTRQLLPKVIVDNSGNIYIAWPDCRNSNCIEGHTDLYFSKSTDNGTTWNANIKINDASDSVYRDVAPGFAVDGSGNLYAIWPDYRDDVSGMYHRIYFSKSSDGGAHWSANARVSDNPPTNTLEYAAMSLVVDTNSNIYAAWGDNRTGEYNAYFVRSTDSGVSWSANAKITPGTGHQEYAVKLALDGYGNLYAIWEDHRSGGDIYFSRWSYSGSSLVATTAATNIYPGDPISVDLTIQNADNLYAAQADCSVDAAVIRPQDAVFGNFFDPLNRLIGANSANAEAGTWTGAISQRSPALPLSGNGLFATVNYQAQDPGNTSMECEVVISDQDGFTQPVTFTGTSITVLPFAIVDGVAKYQGRTDHVGITVSGPIPPDAITDSDGNFTLEMKTGTSQSVTASAPGYLPNGTNVDATSGETTSLPATTLRGGDVNNDGVINIADATLVAANFGKNVPPGDARADINADDKVNIQDLAILGSNYGLSGLQPW